MTEYHTIYKGPEGETTQWEDIQRKMGNLPPKAPVWKPEKYKPEVEQAKDGAWIDNQDAEELSDMEDEFSDDRFLEEYRQKRIRELLQKQKQPRFGTVEEIRAAEFVQKVTEASRGSAAAAAAEANPSAGASKQSATAAAPPAGSDATGSAVGGQAGAAAEPGPQSGNEEEEGTQGIWVVVQLYKDGHGASALMSKCIDELAERYPSTKFVRIISTDCISKYPDANLPTLLVYHGGSCVKHLVGLSMFGGQRSTPEQVALVLNRLGPVCRNTWAEDEDQVTVRVGGDTEDSRLVRQLVKRVIQAREEGDESSDFDD